MNKMTRLTLFVGAAVLALVAVLPVFAASYTFNGNIASGAQYDLYTVSLLAGESIVATTHCGIPTTLDTILTVYFPGSDSSSTSFADIYNDDGGSEACGGFRNSTLGFSAPVDGIYTFRVDGFGSSTGTYTLNIVTGDVNPLVGDGRVNPQAAAPVVVYCDNGNLHLYSVTGTDLGTVEFGGSLTVAGVVASPLSNGGMQITAPMADKTYRLTVSGCPHGTSQAFTIDGASTTLFSTYNY